MAPRLFELRWQAGRPNTDPPFCAPGIGCVLDVLAAHDGRNKLGQGVRATNVLRLPCGTLYSQPHNQPDRIDVRDSAAATSEYEGFRFAHRVLDRSIQTDGECIDNLVSLARFNARGRLIAGIHLADGVMKTSA